LKFEKEKKEQGREREKNLKKSGTIVTPVTLELRTQDSSERKSENGFQPKRKNTLNAGEHLLKIHGNGRRGGGKEGGNKNCGASVTLVKGGKMEKNCRGKKDSKKGHQRKGEPLSASTIPSMLQQHDDILSQVRKRDGREKASPSSAQTTGFPTINRKRSLSQDKKGKGYLLLPSSTEKKKRG